MGRRLVHALSQLSQDLGIDIVTPEFEILLILLGTGNLSTENLCDASSLSRSGFFHALDRLKHWGLVVCEVSATDRRRKTCRLHPRTETIVAANFEQFRKSKQMAELLFEREGNGSADRPMPRLAHLTCEFRILLHLRLNPGSTNGQIVAAIRASPSTFHRAIGLLLEKGLLHRENCDADRRRTRYFLPQGVIQAIDCATDQFFSWLEDTVPAPASRAPEPRSSQLGHDHAAAVPATRR